MKLLVGILKGAVIGAALGYGAFALGFGGVMNYITYGVIGALVGLLVGRPLWSLITDKNATTFSSLLKMIFGFGVGVGLYALVYRVGHLSLMIADKDVFAWQPSLGGAIGAVWGGFVEIDDAIGDNGDKSDKGKGDKKKPAKAKLAAKSAPADDDVV